MKNIYLIFFSFIVFYNCYSQKEYKLAEEAFKYEEYWNAIENYKIAYSKINDPARKAEITFKIALCYKQLHLSREAELWFKKAIMVKYPDPLAVLYYADALKMNGAFEEAMVEYKNYQKLVPGDKRAEIGIKSCELAAKWTKNPTRYKVENMAFLNSKDQDFSPVFGKKDFKTVYFTSNRAGSKGNEKHARTGAGFFDIWETSVDRKGKWSEPTPIPEPINSPDDEGASSLTPKGNTLYFTRCRVSKKEILGCKIYYSERKGNNWDIPQELKVKGATDTTSIGHPSISDDELTLYFSANLPGGYGGRDIWMLRRDKKGAQFNPEPINLGPDINTPGDEVFPYIRSNGKLYFSSDYHVGIGGLDLFEATYDNKSNKWIVKNMRPPINSPEDDFGIVFEGDLEQGYFSSSRKGGKGGDDIYRFYLPPVQFVMKGFIKDCKTDDPIAGAELVLKGSDGSTQQASSEADGSYKFNLNGNTDYQLFVSKEKYLKTTAGESTRGYETDKEFIVDVCLESYKEPIELPNIEYDLNKWDLRPESMVALDKLVETLNNNPNLVIEIMSHTDFRADDKYNMELSQKRAQSVVNYLIEKGIEADRLVAKGYGESKPKTVDKKMAQRYSFLKEGDVLTEKFIKSLWSVEEQEICHQFNRRTEFRVLREDYVSKKQNIKTPQELPVPPSEQNYDNY